MTNVKGAVDTDEYAESSGTVTFVAQIAANQETKAAPSAACAPSQPKPAEAGECYVCDPRAYSAPLRHCRLFPRDPWAPPSTRGGR